MNERRLKQTQDQLKRLTIAFAELGLKLETTLTPYPRVKKPRGWRIMQREWDYSQCPNCGAANTTYYTSKDETDRPYSHSRYLCGICGRTWESTKIWD